MVSKNTIRFLFFCLTVSVGLCGIGKELKAAEEDVSNTYVVLVDPMLSETEIKEKMNEHRVKYFGVPAEGDSLGEFLRDFAFSGKARLAESIVAAYGSVERLQAEITALVDSNFPDLPTFLKDNNFNRDTVTKEEGQRLREEYTKNLVSLTGSAESFVQKELALQASKYFSSEATDIKVNLKPTIQNFFLNQLSGKLNAFLQATYVECTEERKRLEEWAKGGLTATLQSVMSQTRDAVAGLLNAGVEIKNAANYGILLVQSGQFTDRTDIETLFFRLNALIELLSDTAIVKDKNYITPLLGNLISLNSELEKEESAEFVQQIDRAQVEEFDVGLIAAMLPIEISAGRFAEALVHLQHWFAAKMPAFNEEASIPLILQKVIETSPNLAVDAINEKAMSLLHLDLIVYSNSGSEEEQEEAPIRAGHVDLSNDQISQIALNFANLAALSPQSIGLLTHTKEILLADLISLEDNLELFARLYSYLNQFVAEHSDKFVEGEPWNMDFDRYLDKLYTTSNDLLLQQNYFGLKVLNVIAYGNQKPLDFNFLAFQGEMQINAAAAFLQSAPEFVRDVVTFAQRKMSNGKKNVKEPKALAEYFSAGQPSKTEYFAGFNPQITTTSYTTNYLIKNAADERIGVTVSTDKARLHFLTLQKQEKEEANAAEQQDLLESKNPVNLQTEVVRPVLEDEEKLAGDQANQLKRQPLIVNNAQKTSKGPAFDADEEEELAKEGAKQTVGQPEKQHPNDLGLLDNLHEIDLEPTFEDRVRKEQEQLAALRNKHAKAGGKKGPGAQLDDEDEELSKSQPRQQVIDNGLGEPTEQLGGLDEDELTPREKKMRNQKKQKQPSHGSEHIIEEEIVEPIDNQSEEDSFDERRSQNEAVSHHNLASEVDELDNLDNSLESELDSSFESENSLRSELDRDYMNALKQKRRNGQFFDPLTFKPLFDEGTFNLPTKTKRPSEMLEDGDYYLTTPVNTEKEISQGVQGDDEDELHPDNVTRALNLLKQNLKAGKQGQADPRKTDANLGEPAIDFEKLNEMIRQNEEDFVPEEESEPLLPKLERQNANRRGQPKLQRRDSFGASFDPETFGELVDSQEHIVSDKNEFLESSTPRKSVTPHKIVNKDKNYVRVIEGSKDDPVALALEDMEVMDVVREFQGGVDEQGRKIEIVYIQVARAGSPCAEKIARLRAEQRKR